jgi:hypothetical protein
MEGGRGRTRASGPVRGLGKAESLDSIHSSPLFLDCLPPVKSRKQAGSMSTSECSFSGKRCTMREATKVP